VSSTSTDEAGPLGTLTKINMLWLDGGAVVECPNHRELISVVFLPRA
jgi:hypothetical protein